MVDPSSCARVWGGGFLLEGKDFLGHAFGGNLAIAFFALNHGAFAA